MERWTSARGSSRWTASHCLVGGRRRVKNGAMNPNETSKSINSRCTDFRNSIVEKWKKTL